MFIYCEYHTRSCVWLCHKKERINCCQILQNHSIMRSEVHEYVLQVICWNLLMPWSSIRLGNQEFLQAQIIFSWFLWTHIASKNSYIPPLYFWRAVCIPERDQNPIQLILAHLTNSLMTVFCGTLAPEDWEKSRDHACGQCLTSSNKCRWGRIS